MSVLCEPTHPGNGLLACGMGLVGRESYDGFGLGGGEPNEALPTVWPLFCLRKGGGGAPMNAMVAMCSRVAQGCGLCLCCYYGSDRILARSRAHPRIQGLQTTILVAKMPQEESEWELSTGYSHRRASLVSGLLKAVRGCNGQ